VNAGHRCAIRETRLVDRLETGRARSFEIEIHSALSSIFETCIQWLRPVSRRTCTNLVTGKTITTEPAHSHTTDHTRAPTGRSRTSTTGSLSYQAVARQMPRFTRAALRRHFAQVTVGLLIP